MVGTVARPGLGELRAVRGQVGALDAVQLLRLGEEALLVGGAPERVEEAAALVGVRVVGDGAGAGEGDDRVEGVPSGGFEPAGGGGEQVQAEEEGGEAAGRRGQQGRVEDAVEAAGEVPLEQDEHGRQREVESGGAHRPRGAAPGRAVPGTGRAERDDQEQGGAGGGEQEHRQAQEP
ncbi:hypothetical protein ACFYUJ_32620 [Streptomyces sp. NPDC004520]|uniref:hypothetical protein n=1 Tax=Streptomyces sp. NPDC004520 TaxID=3364702 RepID=UPI0036AF095F